MDEVVYLAFLSDASRSGEVLSIGKSGFMVCIVENRER